VLLAAVLLAAGGALTASLLVGGAWPGDGSGAATKMEPTVQGSARSVERFVFARLGRLSGTAQFLDPTSGLPRTNTAVHCTKINARGFTCVVRSPAASEAVLDLQLVGGSVRVVQPAR